MPRRTRDTVTLNCLLAILGGVGWSLQIVVLAKEDSYVDWEAPGAAASSWSRGYSCGVLDCEQGGALQDRPSGVLGRYMRFASGGAVLAAMLMGAAALCHFALMFPSLHPDLSAPPTVASRWIETLWVTHAFASGGNVLAWAALLGAYQRYLEAPSTSLSYGVLLLVINSVASCGCAVACYQWLHLRHGKDAYIYAKPKPDEEARGRRRSRRSQLTSTEPASYVPHAP
eukprot:TRINITY_DN12290_c0_g1_i1.p2 TRINITY_DN12290_c0_g1~~TRINITY_DN12290_c0_g1_i1.p2  ORF type:complete len:228 (+),score=51.35 TRINITY_DN12290_c0_g1_i1:125-808(+)